MNHIKSKSNFIQNLPRRFVEVGTIKMGCRDRSNSRKSSAGNTYYLPKKNDFFMIMKKALDDDGFAIPDIAAMDKLGCAAQQDESGNWYSDPPLTEIDIAFSTNQLDLIFHSSYRYYSNTELICVGDGETAEHKITEEKGQVLKIPKKEIIPCTCKYLELGKCKPYGELSCMILKSPTFSGIYKLRTTGFNTTTYLQSSIAQMHSLTKGRLAQIPFKLKLKMQDGQFTNAKTGKVQKTTFPIAYIEFELGTDKLIERANVVEMGIPEGSTERTKKYLMDKDNYGDENDERLINEEFSPGTMDDDTQFDLDLTDEIKKVDKREDVRND